MASCREGLPVNFARTAIDVLQGKSVLSRNAVQGGTGIHHLRPDLRRRRGQMLWSVENEASLEELKKLVGVSQSFYACQSVRILRDAGIVFLLENATYRRCNAIETFIHTMKKGKGDGGRYESLKEGVVELGVCLLPWISVFLYYLHVQL